eukprot:scaffold32973_cov31-Tisochrysis_lutea.AAC.2
MSEAAPAKESGEPGSEREREPRCPGSLVAGRTGEDFISIMAAAASAARGEMFSSSACDRFDAHPSPGTPTLSSS